MAGVLTMTVLGRVGKNPETRTLDSGSKVTKFTVATSEKYKNRQGETVENTTWVTVEAWEKSADILAQYVKKGDQIYLVGTPKAEAWTDKDGNAKGGLVLKVREFSFIGGNNTTSEPATQAAAPAAGGEDGDGELPF